MDKKDALKNRKVYVRYVCDDRIKLSVMGTSVGKRIYISNEMPTFD